jgi:type IV fimbrial biogenesis protein FimT
LTELLVTLSVTATLTALGVPTFSELLIDREARSTAYELLGTIRYARSEAIKRNAQVLLTAAETGWSDGWIVTDGEGGEIKTHVKSAPKVDVLEASNTTTIAFNAVGRVPQNTVFEVCTPESDQRISRRLVRISSSGVPMIRIDGDCGD